jgi:hypothetical protein
MGASVTFPPSPQASVCGFQLGLPRFKFSFQLPGISFPPQIPIPFIAFKLSCNPRNPVDITAGLKLPFGGGRSNRVPANPDDNYNSP